MPRNGSGTMSVSNAFTSGTTIQSSSMNANFTDVAAEITNSLPRDGQAGMTGAMKAASGSVTAPSITFGGDTDTGLYRKDSNVVGIVAGGTEVGTITTSGQKDANGVIIVGMPTGVMLPYSATVAPAGWVRINGRTIGSATSGATERANADCESLFIHLWGYYANTICAVSGGRGASGAADFAANKTIALPDLRGRTFFGLDDMGNSAAGRIGTIYGSPTTNGYAGGAETTTLTEAQLPVHQHVVSITSGSESVGHTHAVSITSSGASASHTHYVSGTTDANGGHSHTYSQGQASTAQSGGSQAILATNATGNTSTVADHTHTFSATTGGNSVDHTHLVSGTTADRSAAHTHLVSGNTGSTGSGAAHSNMPPGFLGTWIIKL